MKAITEFETDRTFYNFINAINEEETKTKYYFCLKDFMKFNNVDRPYLLLNIEIERQIIDYILHLRKLNLSSNTVKTRVAAIYLYYAMNDVLLNKTKINKYQGEFVKVAKDRPYSQEEIHKLLDVADLRMKICILLMASSGLRIGSIHSIQMKHLEKVDDIYKITVYENSNQEYYTFSTPELASFIDEYKKYRERNGEKVTAESYLIRDHFDDYAPLAVKEKARPITKHTIREITAKLLVKTGTRLVGQVHLSHGFRKFFTNQLIEADLQTEKRWKLEGHKLKANDPAYVRTSEKLLLQEFYKAVPLLTISNEERLKFKLEERVQIERTQVESLRTLYDKLKSEVADMKKRKK